MILKSNNMNNIENINQQIKNQKQVLDIAVIQMISTPIVTQNLQKTEELIAKACIKPVDLIS